MTGPKANDTVLRVSGLRLETTEGRVLAPGLDMALKRGEILGLVGESGSGKTLFGFAVAGLLPPGVRVSAGEVHLLGQRIDNLPETRRRRIRGESIGVVFQDPLSSFNPVRTIGSILVESLMRHGRLPRDAARARAIDILKTMRLPGEDASVDAYPHTLSGGQRQRAMIGLALANDPALLIADEPTTALDPTIQLQILALLKRRATESACLLITHDLAAAGAVCDRIAVMHRGEIVEEGPAQQVLGAPAHPYTRSLLAHAPLEEDGA